MLNHQASSYDPYGMHSNRPSGVDKDAVVSLYTELMSGVPDDERANTLKRFATLRRASDRLLLRTALFDVIARHLGQREATARLSELDRRSHPE